NIESDLDESDVPTPPSSSGGIRHAYRVRNSRDRHRSGGGCHPDPLLQEKNLTAMTLAAIFDLDGTLVTFRFDVKGTREALLRELEVRGLSTSDLGQSTPTQKILEEARRQIPGESVSEFEELRRVSYEILDKFELASAPTTEPLP